MIKGIYNLLQIFESNIHLTMGVLCLICSFLFFAIAKNGWAKQPHLLNAFQFGTGTYLWMFAVLEFNTRYRIDRGLPMSRLLPLNYAMVLSIVLAMCVVYAMYIYYHRPTKFK